MIKYYGSSNKFLKAHNFSCLTLLRHHQICWIFRGLGLFNLHTHTANLNYKGLDMDYELVGIYHHCSNSCYFLCSTYHLDGQICINFGVCSPFASKMPAVSLFVELQQWNFEWGLVFWFCYHLEKQVFSLKSIFSMFLNVFKLLLVKCLQYLCL